MLADLWTFSWAEGVIVIIGLSSITTELPAMISSSQYMVGSLALGQRNRMMTFFVQRTGWMSRFPQVVIEWGPTFGGFVSVGDLNHKC